MKPNGMVNYQYHDICDELAGEYPKDFMWTGWHPQCRCVMIPITIKTDDLTELMRQRSKARKEGKDVNAVKVGKDITEMPDNFKAWMSENAERLEKAKSVPYWAEPYIDFDITRETHVKNGGGSRTANKMGSELMQDPSYFVINSVTPKQAEKLDELASVLGIKRGEPMTFEQANNGRANPYYSAKNYATSNNCTNCNIAYVLRRQGLNVYANGYSDNPNDWNYKIGANTKLSWLDKNGNSVQYSWKNYDKNGDIIRKYSEFELYQMLDKQTSKLGTQYQFGYTNKISGEGHIMVIERTNKGLIAYDPQDSSFITPKQLITCVDLNDQIELLRVDNLLINTEIVKSLVIPYHT